MKKLIAPALVAALALTLTGGAPVAEPTAEPAPGPESPTLELIKGLVGTWVEVDENGEPTDTVKTIYRITAGGSAVLETLFPGSNHEMLTVYHMDGKDLVLTHYCAEGNQPQFKAKFGKNRKQLVYEFVRGTNITESGRHMNHAVVDLLGEGRYRAKWTMKQHGQSVYEAQMDVVRRKEKPSR